MTMASPGCAGLAESTSVKSVCLRDHAAIRIGRHSRSQPEPPRLDTGKVSAPFTTPTAGYCCSVASSAGICMFNCVLLR